MPGAEKASAIQQQKGVSIGVGHFFAPDPAQTPAQSELGIVFAEKLACSSSKLGTMSVVK